MNQNYFRFRFALIIMMALIGSVTLAQISEGGTPASFSKQYLSEQFTNFEFAKPDMDQVMMEEGTA